MTYPLSLAAAVSNRQSLCLGFYRPLLLATVDYCGEQEKQMSESIRVRMKLHNVGGSYFIRSVDSDDEGRYICRVSNSLGSKELPVNVTVLGIAYIILCYMQTEL